ncbi:YitT family protein [Lactovum odontotermitis]
MKNKFLNSADFDLSRFIDRTSAAVVYGIVSAIALNFFLQPGDVYSSGVTGISQIVYTLLVRGFGSEPIPISLIIWLLNLPLLILAWLMLGKKFTLYTFMSISLSSVFIQLIPKMTLTTDPTINAIFGGVLMGLGVGYVLRNGISSGGTDIVSLIVKKRTGMTVGFLSTIVNGVIIITAGALFGWPHMFYSLIYVFVNGRLVDAVFNRQKKMQVTIVTKYPDDVRDAIFNHLSRGVTFIRGAEGGYTHSRETVMLTVVTNSEYAEFKEAMRESDPQAFVTLAQNIRVLGNFDEEKNTE